MGKMIVSYPITVPDGKYCWQYPHSACEHFDNEGGHSTCGLDFDIGKETNKGILKAKECMELIKVTI